MAHQQNQPQQLRPGIGQGLQQAGLSQQQPQLQQPQFQQSQPPQIQPQQTQPQQLRGTPIPTQTAQQPTPPQASLAPQPTGQQTPPMSQTAQAPPQPSGSIPQSTPQALSGQQFGQPPSAQGGQFAAGQTPPAPQPSIGIQGQPPQGTQSSQMQAQPSQHSQTLGQQTPQTLGQQTPQASLAGQQTPPRAQGQWGAQTPSQPTAQGPNQSAGQPPSGQLPAGQATGQSLQAGGQLIPPQGQEIGTVQQSGEQRSRERVGTPSIDVMDAPDELVLFVDMPGYDEEDIRIQADGQNLTVSATRGDEADGEEGRQFVHERPHRLQRTIQLPSRANVNEADATYENGVCEIRLPKMEEEKQHEIAFQ